MADNKATLERITAFLKEFKEISKVFGLYYNTNKKENLQTLLDLEISPQQRDEYVMNLRPEDYYQGPDVNDYNSEEGPVWMFGIGIKKKRGKKKMPIYIKIFISKDIDNQKNPYGFCISFHKAKFLMTFPYKTEL